MTISIHSGIVTNVVFDLRTCQMYLINYNSLTTTICHHIIICFFILCLLCFKFSNKRYLCHVCISENFWPWSSALYNDYFIKVYVFYYVSLNVIWLIISKEVQDILVVCKDAVTGQTGQTYNVLDQSAVIKDDVSAYMPI